MDIKISKNFQIQRGIWQIKKSCFLLNYVGFDPRTFRFEVSHSTKKLHCLHTNMQYIILNKNELSYAEKQSGKTPVWMSYFKP